MTDTVKKASDYFVKDKLYCSQAVLCAFCEKYDTPYDIALKISCGLNSGCRCAEICGAVSGAILVIGLKYGDSKETCNAKAEQFIDVFKAKNGSIICRSILGCDISTPAGKEAFMRNDLYNTTCANMVISAVQILKDLGY